MKIVERARNLLVQPQREWSFIASEPATVEALYTEYVMVLAAIPALASFVGTSVLGFGGWGFGPRVPMAAGLASMVLTYLLSLGGVYGFALLIDALAPTFAGEKRFIQALKVAAFAPTASWIAGVFYLVPALGILALLGALYSLYLLHTGLAPLMKVPADKAIPFTVVVVIAAIVLMVVIAIIASLPLPSRVRGF